MALITVNPSPGWPIFMSESSRSNFSLRMKSRPRNGGRSGHLVSRLFQDAGSVIRIAGSSSTTAWRHVPVRSHGTPRLRGLDAELRRGVRQSRDSDDECHLPAILEQSGYQVTAAATVPEALDFIRKKSLTCCFRT